LAKDTSPSSREKRARTKGKKYWSRKGGERKKKSAGAPLIVLNRHRARFARFKKSSGKKNGQGGHGGLPRFYFFDREGGTITGNPGSSKDQCKEHVPSWGFPPPKTGWGGGGWEGQNKHPMTGKTGPGESTSHQKTTNLRKLGGGGGQGKKKGGNSGKRKAPKKGRLVKAPIAIHDAASEPRKR